MSTPSDGALAQDCWVLTDGTIGMQVQSLGLAEALGFKPRVCLIRVPWPWSWLPPGLIPWPLDVVELPDGRLQPPWPKVLISCGRRTVAPAAALRKASGGRTFAIHIQNPMIDLVQFDVIVVPRHDRLEGPNVIVTVGGLNRVTEARLAEAAERFGPRYAHLPRPLVAVILGGRSRTHRFTEAAARTLGQGLAEMSRRESAGLLITASRRTDPAVVRVLRQTLADAPAEIWDGSGDNPYFGYLALADVFVVTGDSVNMVCDAATTGKPVHVFDLDGGSAKFTRFHKNMREAGITRPFNGRLDHWTYRALRDTEFAAAEIRRRLAEREARNVSAGAV